MFMDPSTLIASCNLQSTDSVADFGAGSGFVARAAASLVTSGNVFAIEINRDIVARLTREASEMHIKNLHPLWGDIEVAGGSKLGDQSMDMVIISNTLFHVEDKEGCFREAHRVLKQGGRLLVVDWTESFGGMGPRPQAVVSKDVAIALAKRYGFEFLTDALQAGEHHYAILFRKIAS
jgi:ubiquinone/menaquinone biosynthesis C-methylase UbiE